MILINFILQIACIALATAAVTISKSVSFSSALFNTLSKESIDKNIIVSPASIETCLALTYLGAEGITASELKQGLQLQGATKQEVAETFGKLLAKTKKGGAKLRLANRIYVDGKFKLAQNFNELASKYFDASAESVQFIEGDTVAENINAWVESQTEQKIKNLISSGSLTADTAAVLINAIYFQADWLNSFNDVSTTPKEFTRLGGDKVQVETMYQSDYFNHAELKDLDATALELGYVDTDISLLIILPNSVDGLSALESQLESLDMNKISSALESRKVYVSLPKFKIEFDISLQPVLEELGLKTLFTNNADFSSLVTSKKPLHISEVKHKAFIEVNEKGTTAAGATYVSASAESAIINEKTYTFNVDHPFFFAIKDTQTTYFIGHVTTL